MNVSATAPLAFLLFLVLLAWGAILEAEDDCRAQCYRDNAYFQGYVDNTCFCRENGRIVAKP